MLKFEIHPIQQTERYLDREVKQVTHRDYKTYVKSFNLPPNLLNEARTVVDIGAGFSSFAEEARDRIPDSQVIAIDPIYETIKNNPDLTQSQLENQADIHLDFDPDYRNQADIVNTSSQQEQSEMIYRHFVEEMREHTSNYLAGSHQDIPLEDGNADLVLACNSIIRTENKPPIIKQALSECLRLLKEHGEVRIAGALACFIFNPKINAVELWYNGDLVPGGSWVQELQQTGHYSDPELMKVFTELEISGVNFYGVIASVDQDSEKYFRFDTLILRKDDKKPEIKMPASEGVASTIKKLRFCESDGFNIPLET